MIPTGFTGVYANAGFDQVVSRGDSVTLDGSASYGHNLSYAWTQLSGTSVTLSSSTDSVITFSTQNTLGELSFELTVTSADHSESDIVYVTVIETPPVLQLTFTTENEDEVETYYFNSDNTENWDMSPLGDIYERMSLMVSVSVSDPENDSVAVFASNLPEFM